MEMILELLSDMKDVLLVLLGAIISIFATLIANRQQHRMNLRQLAVQNKLDTSKQAIGWLMETRSDLSIIIWLLENHEPGDDKLEKLAKRADKLAEKEAQLGQYLSALELYYNLDEIGKKYDMDSIVSRMLSLQSAIDELKDDPRDNALDELFKALDEMKHIFKRLQDAVTEIIELIRQDNLNYLK